MPWKAQGAVRPRGERREAFPGALFRQGNGLEGRRERPGTLQGRGEHTSPGRPGTTCSRLSRETPEPGVAATTKLMNFLPGGHGGHLASPSPKALAFISGSCMIPGLEIIKL